MSHTVLIDGRSFARLICGKCGIEHYVPQSFNDENVKLGAKGGWHCPNGHSRAYIESEADRLRRERDQLKQNEAYYESRISELLKARDTADRRVSAARGQITKMKNRAAAGICPCCNRHFTNLERHMAGKHPGFKSEPDATEHVH